MKTCVEPRVDDLAYEEFSTADQLCRATQKKLPSLLSHSLRSTWGMHSRRRLRPPSCHRRRRRCARACTGGLSLPHSALKKQHIQIPQRTGLYEFDIHPLLELTAILDARSQYLPISRELLYEHYKVRIPYGNRNPARRSVSKRNRQFRPHLGGAHLHLKFVFTFVASCERAGLQPRSRKNGESLSASFGAEISSHTPRSIA